jgi:alpha-tubulin suppressor-like RCC1 family protein
VTALAAGRDFTCALSAEGSVSCWGANTYDTLGGGATAALSLTPVPVAIGKAVAISAGRHHACAVLESGLVSCWGDTFAGQLGHSGNAAGLVSGVSGATAVAAGFDHSCAVVAGGAVSCWGGDIVTQIGKAALVPGLTDATAISAFAHSTCVTLRDGTVTCWADNDHGLTGGTATNPNWKPSSVPGLASVTALASPCAITGGSMACWQMTLGTAGSLVLSTPQDVMSLGPAQAISTCAEYPSRCALLTDGSVWCWTSLPPTQVTGW